VFLKKEDKKMIWHPDGQVESKEWCLDTTGVNLMQVSLFDGPKAVVS